MSVLPVIPSFTSRSSQDAVETGSVAESSLTAHDVGTVQQTELFERNERKSPSRSSRNRSGLKPIREKSDCAGSEVSRFSLSPKINDSLSRVHNHFSHERRLAASQAALHAEANRLRAELIDWQSSVRLRAAALEPYEAAFRAAHEAAALAVRTFAPNCGSPAIKAAYDRRMAAGVARFPFDRAHREAKAIVVALTAELKNVLAGIDA